LHFCFSGRRRHTRFSRDWSSDVCSPDLSKLWRNQMWRNHVWRNEKGSALFLTAIAMVVLLGFAALVTDVGLLYLNRYQLANAADAAALAGVQELPWSSWSAERRALAYGELNGVTGLTVQVSPNWQE